MRISLFETSVARQSLAAVRSQAEPRNEGSRRIRLSALRPLLLAIVVALTASAGWAEEKDSAPAKNKELPPIPNPAAEAKTEKEMKPYTETIPGTDVTFEMVPIQGGVFVMGSPPDEKGREPDEGPQHKVNVEPFWMGKHEVTWNEYDIWSFSLDVQRRRLFGKEASPRDELADAVTRPTKPYTDMTFGMGHDGFPAICMTQLAAKMYCEWLSAKTGRHYRLPTEAEWEYACRAGTTTAYSFGGDPSQLDEYAWSIDNSVFQYHKVGRKKPNPWGLYDMHGNVAEWVLDQYDPDFYSRFQEVDVAEFPIAVPKQLYPRVVRGGSWDNEAKELRSANRMHSTPDWKMQDPQIPQSIWYHTDALHVGFRVIRPLESKPEKIRKKLKLQPVPEDLKEE